MCSVLKGILSDARVKCFVAPADIIVHVMYITCCILCISNAKGEYFICWKDKYNYPFLYLQLNNHNNLSHHKWPVLRGMLTVSWFKRLTFTDFRQIYCHLYFQYALDFFLCVCVRVHFLYFLPSSSFFFFFDTHHKSVFIPSCFPTDPHPKSFFVTFLLALYLQMQ